MRRGFGPGPNSRIALLSRNAGPPAPVLALNPASVTTNVTAPSGTLLALITNVPAGVTPTITPNDGRLSIAGSEATGWEIWRGATAGSPAVVNFTIAAAGATAANFAVTFETQWGVGLDWTPDYVPGWRLPATIAQGKAQGLIPVDAIEYETGNAGGPFADVNAWLDACFAANKPGAIQTSVSFSGKVQKYLKRGLYGAGATKPVIEWLSRASSSSTGGNGRQCWLYTDMEDVTIRGIAFKNFSSVLGTTYPTLPLTDDLGALQNDGYAASNQYEWQVLQCRNDGTPENSFGFHHRRLGRIAVSGSVSVNQVVVTRQIQGTPAAGSSGSTNNNVYFSDATWATVTETVSLFTGGLYTTNAQIRDAINAGSGTHNYAAELNLAGEVIVKPVDWTTKAFFKIEVSYTGTGSVASDCKTPRVDVSHCDFVDVSCAVISYIDVSQLGAHKFCKNDLPGTWGGMSLWCHHWSDVWCANNNWRDVNPSRPIATGRTASTPSSGGGLIAFGSLCYVGSNYPHLMRYYAIPEGTTCLIENNRQYQVNDPKNTDNVNTGVLGDSRNGSQKTSAGKIIRYAYNLVRECFSPNGGDDACVFYGKNRGMTIVANDVDGFGSAYFSASFNGTECSFATLKEPGPFAATYGGYVPEQIVVSGNLIKTPPQGMPIIKIDNCYGGTAVNDNWIEGYEAVTNGVEAATDNTHGAIRITGYHKTITVSGNMFRNCYQGIKATLTQTKPWLLINLHDIRNADGIQFTAAMFLLSNNRIWNDGVTWPIAGADLASMRINFGGNGPSSTAAFFAALPTGGNDLFNAGGSSNGFKMLVYSQSNTTIYPGTQTATVEAFQPQSEFLTAYAVAA